ncbi:LLM class flavin-dependent oxidoreductase, partial [Streptomyces sp. NPDC058320]|uniref:LLM class flavin-dependent oxidoreductase n=1 Tax=Streptomyces sp. NPDC058320 TaxID=3346444 RepID=UPI0036E899FB
MCLRDRLLHWYLPARRPADIDSLAPTALAAERAGFDSLSMPAGGPDPWALASGLCRQTERIGFLVGGGPRPRGAPPRTPH